MMIVVFLHAAAGVMWGISEKSALVSIDMTNGKMHEQTPVHPNVLEAQELSAIDTERSRVRSTPLLGTC